MIDLTKKATIATIKSFIKKNRQNLLISVRSSFDGMCDGVRDCEDQGFSPALEGGHADNSFGIQGAWFVGSSRDYITPFNKNENGEVFEGYEIYNCCSHFLLGVKCS